jgi:hypothetical protein
MGLAFFNARRETPEEAPASPKGKSKAKAAPVTETVPEVVDAAAGVPEVVAVETVEGVPPAEPTEVGAGE